MISASGTTSITADVIQALRHGGSRPQQQSRWLKSISFTSKEWRPTPFHLPARRRCRPGRDPLLAPANRQGRSSACRYARLGPRRSWREERPGVLTDHVAGPDCLARSRRRRSLSGQGGVASPSTSWPRSTNCANGTSSSGHEIQTGQATLARLPSRPLANRGEAKSGKRSVSKTCAGLAGQPDCRWNPDAKENPVSTQAKVTDRRAGTRIEVAYGTKTIPDLERCKLVGLCKGSAAWWTRDDTLPRAGITTRRPPKTTSSWQTHRRQRWS